MSMSDHLDLEDVTEWGVEKGVLEEYAKEHIEFAKKCLAKMVIDKCYGSETYSDKRMKLMRQIMIQLMQIEDMF